MTHFLQGEDKKGPSPAGIDDDGHKLGVDGTEGAVPCDPGHADVIVALVVPHRLAEDVAELALSHNSPQHICQWGRQTNGRCDCAELRIAWMCRRGVTNF